MKKFTIAAAALILSTAMPAFAGAPTTVADDPYVAIDTAAATSLFGAGGLSVGAIAVVGALVFTIIALNGDGTVTVATSSTTGA